MLLFTSLTIKKKGYYLQKKGRRNVTQKEKEK